MNLVFKGLVKETGTLKVQNSNFGGRLTTDAGVLLLREVDRALAAGPPKTTQLPLGVRGQFRAHLAHPLVVGPAIRLGTGEIRRPLGV